MVWPTPYDEKHDVNSPQHPGQQLRAAYAKSTLDHILNLSVEEPPSCQRLTNIVASIGKSSNNLETLEQLLAAGMNVALLNLYFASKQENIEMIKAIKKAVKNYSAKIGRPYPLAIAIRLSGRKMRTGKISETYGNEVELKYGSEVRITTDENYHFRCSANIIFIDYLNFTSQIRPDDYVMIDNEKILLKVDSIGLTMVTCKVERGGLLGSWKDVVVPYAVFDMPNYTESDKEFLEVAIHYQVDIIIASFTISDESILELRHLLGEKGEKICIVADIQTIEGFRNYNSILKVSDGIMITRQELGKVISQKNMILAQKNMVARANKANVFVFVSAQFLTSMKFKKIALRSELLDIGNCVVDGADGLVLSGETAIGLYPVDALLQMAATCKEAEACIWTKRVFADLLDLQMFPLDEIRSLALAAVLASNRLMATAIIVLTQNINTVKVVSMFKPRCPIIAVTRYLQLARQLNTWRAVIPLLYEDTPDVDWQLDVENRAACAIKWATEEGFMSSGDPYVLLSGWKSSTKNVCTMRIDNI